MVAHHVRLQMDGPEGGVMQAVARPRKPQEWHSAGVCRGLQSQYTAQRRRPTNPEPTQANRYARTSHRNGKRVCAYGPSMYGV